jgi:hypothetical protein
VIAVVTFVEVIWLVTVVWYVVTWLKIRMNNFLKVAFIKRTRKNLFVFFKTSYIRYSNLRRRCHCSRTCWDSLFSHCKCHTILIWLNIFTKMINMPLLNTNFRFIHTYQ